MKIRDKVLIVEDEQNIKNFMSTILAANGFDTLMAGSAKEALSMISSHCPDLIILDLGLPDMDGMEVLKQVRAWSSVPVIVVSARTITSKSPSGRVNCLPASARPSAIRARALTTTPSRSPENIRSAT